MPTLDEVTEALEHARADPAHLVLVDDTPTDEIDRAILYCLDTPELDPRIRSAFVDAMLDKRNRAKTIQEPACP